MNADKLPLIYGTAWKKDKTKALVIQAVKAGFRGIDTACQPKHYNEAGVGEALVSLEKEGFKREDLFLQTKFTLIAGQDPLNIPYDEDASLSEQVAQSFEISKANLQTSYIDSLVLHSPPAEFEDLVTVWKAMEKIVQSGEVKQLGISNIYNLKMLKDLYTVAEVKPSLVQNRFYEKSAYDKKIRSFCLMHSIGYQSFWTLTANPHILKSKELLELSAKYGKDVIAVFFAYLNEIGITPLTGTRKIEHMKSDLQSVDIILEVQEVSRLNTLLQPK